MISLTRHLAFHRVDFQGMNGFDSSSRVLMIAPHPDDESLAAGVLLQQAITSGAAVRVIYVTDGDDNPWPQRALEKRWRLSAADRARWGKRRRKEAIAALEVLGLRAADARFLGMPDQGLTRALLHDGVKASMRIGRMIADWAPTHLLFPSELDTHPDHSAVALLVRFAIDDFKLAEKECALLSYLVHGKRAQFARQALELHATAHETSVKRSAILAHWTQVKFSRRRFLSYGLRPECFRSPGHPQITLTNHRNCAAFRDREQVRLLLRFRLKSLGVEPTTLNIVGRDRKGSVLAVCMQLPPRNASIQVTDCATGHRVGIATYRGHSFGGMVALPVTLFAADRPLFAKLRQRRWFFDKAGWMEIGPAPFAARPASAALAQEAVSA
jgi:LmbE family N-acetylglucosaminyl deacetylase